jgi:hydroxyacylglutathione hydrolase
MLLNPKQKLALIAENEHDAVEAALRLARVGLKRVVGYSLADEAQWKKEGIALTTIAILRCDTVRQTLERDPPMQLVDVRSRAEWLKGHLPGAISMPLHEIESEAARIDPSKSSLVYCREGFRATTAASILLRESSADIGILIDGIEGWSALGLPLDVPNGA